MKLLERSRLPIYMDEYSYQLKFQDGLTCESKGARTFGEMAQLFRNPAGIDPNEQCYDFYRNIVFEKDSALFQKNDFRYDITVIFPGTINREFKKTSGHYHGYIAGHQTTYPEIYEVLEGRALYILQKAVNFDQNEEPVICDRRAVFVEAGQAIIIPPLYGHCSINVGEGPMVFSNIAVVSCPLHYDIIKAKHGLSIYALKNEDCSITLESNTHYQNVSNIRRYYPLEDSSLGIRSSGSVYHEFVNSPEKFEYLLHPQDYEKRILNMYAETTDRY